MYFFMEYKMFGSENSDYVVILKVIDTRFPEKAPIASKSGKFSSMRVQKQLSYFYGFDVLFDSPVVLRKGIMYCVKATIDGPNSWFVCCGLDHVQCHGVKFSFLNCQRMDCCMTDDEGQFAAFPFRRIKIAVPQKNMAV